MKKLLATTALATALLFSAGAMAHEGEHTDGAPGMHSVVAGLPEADARKFHEAMHQAHDKVKGLKEKMHALHEDLYRITTADSFDQSAYLAKTRELAKLHDKIHGIMSESFAAALAQLPQDERTSIADAMKKMHEQWHHHHWQHAAGHDGQHGSGHDDAPAAPASADQ